MSSTALKAVNAPVSKNITAVKNTRFPAKSADKATGGTKRKAEDPEPKKLVKRNSSYEALTKKVPTKKIASLKAPVVVRKATDYRGRLEDMTRECSEQKLLLKKATAAAAEAEEKAKYAAAFEEKKFQEAIENLAKGRDDITEERDALEVELNVAKAFITEMKEAQAEYEAEVEETAALESSLRDEIARTRAAMKTASAGNAAELAQLKGKLLVANIELSEKEAELAATNTALEGAEAATADFAFELDSARGKLAAAEATIAERDSELSAAYLMSADASSTITELRGKLAEKEAELIDAATKAAQDEQVRRALHNTVQELKGNVRVFCRIRPAAQDKKVAKIALPGNDFKKLELETESISSTGGKATIKTQEYGFDHVFGPTASQVEVFEEISHLVQSALDGYNICVFAYGQTGSGKTHTMEGGSGDSRGMIPRSVEQVFATAKKLEEVGWVYKFEASFLEIYNETIRDLLAPMPVPKNHIEAQKILENMPKYDIKHSGKNSTSVTNLTVATVNTADQVLELLQKAGETRSTAKTLMNSCSSRSHSVFTLKLTGVNEGTGSSCSATISLVDLAGSERLDKSGATGDRLKEALAINKSLSALGSVYAALGSSAKHVPYRDSKLTYLLQNSLGGNSKSLMFVNVAGEADSAPETVCSLRFATKVNACHIGTAKQSK